MRRRLLEIGTKCAHGHLMTVENSRVRPERRDCIECRTCNRIARQRFNARKPVYDVWRTMIQRCEDPMFTDWHLYGGKGVVVCNRWLQSYDSFATDMGPRPRGTTLDRIDSNGHYEPSNCRWATPKTQARNMSRNRHIEYGGERLTIAEWAERFGIKYMRLYHRIHTRHEDLMVAVNHLLRS